MLGGIDYLYGDGKVYKIAKELYDCDPIYKYYSSKLNNELFINVQEIKYFITDNRITNIEYIILPGEEINFGPQIFENVTLHFTSDSIFEDRNWITLENGYKLYVEKYPPAILYLRRFKPALKKGFFQKVTDYLFSGEDYEKYNYEDIFIKKIQGIVKLGEYCIFFDNLLIL